MLFFVWILFALIVGTWANSWNRSFIGYGLMSLFLSPLFAIIVLLVTGKNAIKCQKCAEKIKPEALVCRYCQYQLKPEDKTGPTPEDISHIG